MTKKTLCTGLAALLLLEGAASLTAFAASPEFARSESEWATLRDNTLEWNEIPDLVHEYNATVLTNDDNYKKNTQKEMDAEEVRNELLDQADDLDELAVQFDSSDGGSVMAATYRQQANAARQQADESASDGETIKLGYDQTEAQIVLSVKTLFIQYYQAISDKEYAEKAIAYQEKQYASAVNRQAVGMGTQLETLSAKEALETAQASLSTADAAIKSARQNLIVLCGWRYDADAEIGALPEPDLAAIDAVSLEADTETALANSYTLKIDQKKLANAQRFANMATQISNYEKQLRDDTNQIKLSVKTSYDNLLNAKVNYQNTSAKLVLARENLETAKRQLALGSISQMEYYTSENEVTTLEGQEIQMKNSLLSAYVSYEAAIGGLASAGTGA